MYRTFVVGGVVALVVAASASAAQLNVPAEFATIQAALDAAADGDEILVQPGVYVETIDFLGKDVAVIGVDGAEATTIDGGGQAVWVVGVTSGESAAVLEGVTVTGAVSSESDAGGVHVSGSSLTLRGVIVRDNGGVGLHATSADVALIDSALLDNDGGYAGGGVNAHGGSLMIEGGTIAGNEAYNGGGISAAGTTLSVRGTLITGNRAQQFGAGLYGIHLDLSMEEVRFEGNGTSAELEGGGVILDPFGGGGVYVKSSAGTIARSSFVGNNAFAGGNLYIRETSEIRVENCVVTRGAAGIGGAMYCNTSSPTIVNCTVVGNDFGGIYTTYNAFPQVFNTVFADNSSFGPAAVYGNGIPNIRYSLVEGADLFNPMYGEGVINDAPDLDDELRPTAGSAVIDAGDNSAVPEGVTTDVAGNPRFVDDPETEDSGVGTPPIVDMGAFEFQVDGGGLLLGDLNCDGHHSNFDIDSFVLALTDPAGYAAQHPGCDIMLADMNGDGVVNNFDIAPFVALITGG